MKIPVNPKMNQLSNIFIWIFSLRKEGGIRTLLSIIRRPFKLRRALKLRSVSEATFIGITGSSGKSTTTALLSHILGSNGRVRSQVLDNLYNGLLKTMSSLEAQDDFVVVETAVAKHGDMAPQVELLKPDVAIVTMIGIEHYSAFRSKEAVAQEKSALVRSLTSSGLAILNADDPLVMQMASKTKARCITYGWSESADYRITRTAGKFPDALKIWLGGF